MNKLPTETLYHIVGYLDIEDALRLTEANRYLAQLAADSNGVFWTTRLAPIVPPRSLSPSKTAMDYYKFLYPLHRPKTYIEVRCGQERKKSHSDRIRFLRKYRSIDGWKKALTKKESRMRRRMNRFRVEIRRLFSGMARQADCPHWSEVGSVHAYIGWLRALEDQGSFCKYVKRCPLCGGDKIDQCIL